MDAASAASAEIPSLALIAAMRLRCVERAVAAGLVAWGEGARDVELYFDVPHARDVLALQARGRRCVTLLEDDAHDAEDKANVLAKGSQDPLAFCMHDLCHLEKFVDPEHHVAQVGFFATLHAAMGDPSWGSLDAGFDEAWAADRDHVAADMNGSPIFLFAALKMKLKMAVRRRVARERGITLPPFGGALDPGELCAFDEALEELLDRLSLCGETREAALAVSTRRDAHDAAMTLQRHFEDAGRGALED